MVQKLFMILMVIFAILSINSKKLRRSIVHMGIFSLISSFCYLLYNAPDVAISEAIIGSTIATILYLVALQKYKVITIYFSNEISTISNNNSLDDNHKQILNLIENYFINKELEPQVIFTNDTLENIHNNYDYNLIISLKPNNMIIYNNGEQNYQYDGLKKYLFNRTSFPIKFTAYKEEGE